MHQIVYLFLLRVQKALVTDIQNEQKAKNIIIIISALYIENALRTLMYVDYIWERQFYSNLLYYASPQMEIISKNILLNHGNKRFHLIFHRKSKPIKIK